MRGYFMGGSRRNQPVETEPLNPRKRERHPAPADRGNAATDGFTRLSAADPHTGIRPSAGVGATPVYPPYHEDM